MASQYIYIYVNTWWARPKRPYSALYHGSLWWAGCRIKYIKDKMIKDKRVKALKVISAIKSVKSIKSIKSIKPVKISMCLVYRSQWASTSGTAQTRSVVNASGRDDVDVSAYKFFLEVGFELIDGVFICIAVIDVLSWRSNQVVGKNIPCSYCSLKIAILPIVYSRSWCLEPRVVRGLRSGFWSVRVW